MDIGKLIGGAVGGASPVGQAASLADAANHLLGYFKLSKDVQAQIQAQLTSENIDLEKLKLAGALAEVQGQLEINKAEAASPNWIVAGWRPYIGWICGTGLLWAKLGQPFAVFVMSLFHWSLRPGQVPLPTVDIMGLLELLGPMLGLAGLRTVEKITDTAGNH
jgi:hypothetical protein